MGDEAEGEDSGSKDCDHDCGCVVEWWRVYLNNDFSRKAKF